MTDGGPSPEARTSPPASCSRSSIHSFAAMSLQWMRFGQRRLGYGRCGVDEVGVISCSECGRERTPGRLAAAG